MKTGIAIAILAFGSFLMVRGASPSTDKPAVEMLNDAYAQSDQFDKDEFPYFLLDLTKASNKVHSKLRQKGIDTSNTTKEWATKLFHLSFRMTDPWNRVAMEKNALIQLSEVDPVLAMQLFSQVEHPEPDDDGLYPEDVRADAAPSIFKNYWESPNIGLSGLPAIRAEARHIGETGEYPYRAMGKVIIWLNKISGANSKTDINDIFREALGFYARTPSKFGNHNKEFEIFLEDTNGCVSDEALFTQALHTFVVQAIGDIGKSSFHFSAEIRTPQGTVPFTDRNETFLFRLFPIIAAHDTGLRDSLLQKFPYLSKSSSQIDYVSHGFVQHPLTPEETAKLHQKLYEMSQISKIQQIQQKDPFEAKRLAEGLSDSGIRALGITSAIPGLVQKDQDLANKTYSDQLANLQEISDGLQNLRVRVALAEAASSLDDTPNFQILSAASFEQGMQIFGEDSRWRPDLRTAKRRGMSELREIVEFATSHHFKDFSEKIYQIPASQVKGYLLIALAQGQANGP